MNSFRIIQAVMRKERDDLFHNKRMLLIAFLFPIMYGLLSGIGGSGFAIDGASFILMHTILVPVLMIASIVAEEKERNTLKMLMLANVNVFQYFIGIIMMVFTFVLAGFIIFDTLGAMDTMGDGYEILFLLCSVMCSFLIGGIIGAFVENQVSVGPITVPIVLVIFFIPVASMFEPKISKVGDWLYSGVLLHILQGDKAELQSWIALGINFIIIGVIFICIFNRSRIIQSVSR